MVAFDASRIGMIIAGLEVPHTHLHVLPIWGMADLDFKNVAPGPPEDFAEVAARLRTALATAGHPEATASR